jgi:hypothetical protein
MNKSRRNFSKQLPLAALLLAAPSCTSDKNGLSKGVIIHQVFIWLKDKADLEKAMEGCMSLSKISSVLDLKVGTPSKTPKRPIIDDSYDIALMVVLKDMASHDHYQEDPIHEDFRQAFSDRFEKVQIYDFDLA